VKQKGKLSPEEWVREKQRLAAEPGTFVVRSNTLESRFFLNRMREYDRYLSWVRAHIGIDIDQEKALDFINRGRDIEDRFNDIVKDMRKFVDSHIKQSRKNGDSTPGRAVETGAATTGSDAGSSSAEAADDSPVDPESPPKKKKALQRSSSD